MSGVKRFRKYTLIYTLIPVVILFVIIVCAIFADYIAPYNPIEVNLDNVLLPPFFEEGGNLTHILGTDDVGRDILSRIIHGSRISVIVGLVAASIAAAFGVCLGLIAGYIRWCEPIIMRLVEVVLATPYIFGALLIVTVFMLPGLGTVIVVIALWTWPVYTKMVWAEVLGLREKDYVILSQISGASSVRVMFRHLLPNCVSTIIVLLTLDIGRAVLFESTLSFLGVGVLPPTPSWGLMCAEGRVNLATSWWLSAMPGFALFMMVGSINFIGDWLSVKLDPKRRHHMLGR